MFGELCSCCCLRLLPACLQHSRNIGPTLRRSLHTCDKFEVISYVKNIRRTRICERHMALTPNAAFGASERDTQGDAEIDSVGVEMTEGNKVHPAEQEEETEGGGTTVKNEENNQADKNGENRKNASEVKHKTSYFFKTFSIRHLTTDLSTSSSIMYRDRQKGVAVC